ncbi:unnamed protein product [Tetraodon nigroviridis]|uniref:(spotted green pufferfish) hypothetical protein n=1 Tax=Tetraodon nigroviridis TaxID=99883 RepID=Q4RS53_TETNG|nr:unnamed protein product [Tetraodon nigroviridis]
MAATDHSRSEAAKQRRQDQLQRWLGSETDRTGSEARDTLSASGTRRAKVRFAQGAVFMAACSAGDREEVAALLRQGADINHANIDGLTALHQACIDENAEMVQFLVESGSDINRGDNEGWTPLHAAASCGFIQIVKFLIEHGAHVGAVNSEGELPLDVATEDAMERLLKEEIKKQGEKPAASTAAGTSGHLSRLLSSRNRCGQGQEGGGAGHAAGSHGRAGRRRHALASPQHQGDRPARGLGKRLHRSPEGAAALRRGREQQGRGRLDAPARRRPLGAGGGVRPARRQHVRHGRRQQRGEASGTAGGPTREGCTCAVMMRCQCPCRAKRLWTWQTRTWPTRWRSCRRNRTPTSISRMSSKEKICLHEREKHPSPALPSGPVEDEEEEGQTGQGQPQSQGKASSSSSSEEESESESDAESEKAKNRELINNLNNKRNTSGLLPTSMSLSSAVSQMKKVKEDLTKPPTGEAPGSWRTSLRKAGSSVTLGSAELTDSSQEQSRVPDPGLGMTRSASSPRLSSEAEAKEPRLARVPPIPTRRLFSIPDSSPESSNSSSYGKRLDDPSVTSANTGTSASGLGHLNSVLSQRLPQEQKDPSAVTSANSQAPTAGEQETKQRRKSYLTPVRDEEAEAQRKARSRHARQSRRSTQGVTLTDLQEAEKTMKTDNKGREKKEEEKEAKLKKAEEGEVSWRSRIASLQKSDLLGLTQPSGSSRPPAADKKDAEASTGENEMERWARERRERRQARARRKAQRTGESDDNEPSGEEEFSGSGLDPRRYLRPLLMYALRSDSSCNDCTPGGETKDFKKLFEEVSRENSQLQSQLQDTQRVVSQTRLELEKATQRQERLSDCSALLELERKVKCVAVSPLQQPGVRMTHFLTMSLLGFSRVSSPPLPFAPSPHQDRRMLERRLGELEEELKVLVDLRADNQRLKDENGALIRVISKLSK